MRNISGPGVYSAFVKLHELNLLPFTLKYFILNLLLYWGHFLKQLQKIHSWQKETVYSLSDYEPFKIKVQRLVVCHHDVFIMKIIVT